VKCRDLEYRRRSKNENVSEYITFQLPHPYLLGGKNGVDGSLPYISTPSHENGKYHNL